MFFKLFLGTVAIQRSRQRWKRLDRQGWVLTAHEGDRSRRRSGAVLLAKCFVKYGLVWSHGVTLGLLTSCTAPVRRGIRRHVWWF